MFEKKKKNCLVCLYNCLYVYLLRLYMFFIHPTDSILPISSTLGSLSSNGRLLARQLQPPTCSSVSKNCCLYNCLYVYLCLKKIVVRLYMFFIHPTDSIHPWLSVLERRLLARQLQPPTRTSDTPYMFGLADSLLHYLRIEKNCCYVSNVCMSIYVRKKKKKNCITESVSAAFSLVRLRFHPPLGLRPQHVVLDDEVRQSEVDIVIQLVDLEAGTTINLVPLEVKSVITKENMTQLATYILRLSSAEQLQRWSVVF